MQALDSHTGLEIALPVTEAVGVQLHTMSRSTDTSEAGGLQGDFSATCEEMEGVPCEIDNQVSVNKSCPATSLLALSLPDLSAYPTKALEPMRTRVNVNEDWPNRRLVVPGLVRDLCLPWAAMCHSRVI